MFPPHVVSNVALPRLYLACPLQLPHGPALSLYSMCFSTSSYLHEDSRQRLGDTTNSQRVHRQAGCLRHRPPLGICSTHSAAFHLQAGDQEGYQIVSNRKPRSSCANPHFPYRPPLPEASILLKPVSFISCLRIHVKGKPPKQRKASHAAQGIRISDGGAPLSECFDPKWAWLAVPPLNLHRGWSGGEVRRHSWLGHSRPWGKAHENSLLDFYPVCAFLRGCCYKRSVSASS